MTAYITSGDIINPLGEGSYSTTLPVGVYAAVKTPMGNYVLNKRDPFTIPAKLYGNAQQIADRVTKRYNRIEGSMGVLLSGLKGSGKTLAAKKIADELQRPVILVETPNNDPAFISFMSSIDDECVVLFDEFDKVYRNREDQNMILSMLDGTSSGSGRKLYIITVNEVDLVSSFMLNRPSRLFYAIEYQSLTAEDIADYCADKGVSPERIVEIQRFSNLFSDFNFDMLAALVEEGVAYPNESLSELVKFMNVKPMSLAPIYDITAYFNDKEFNLGWQNTSRNFLSNGFAIDDEFNVQGGEGDDEEEVQVKVRFGPSDCVADGNLDKFTYTEVDQDGDTIKIVLQKRAKYTPDYLSIL